MSGFPLGIVGVLMAAFVAAPALAVELGDPAPPLKIKEWVKGKPVDLKAGQGKNIYVIEFWATWCPPCRESIPHLTALRKKYADKGVVVVGVTTKDRLQDLGDVVKFVQKLGDRMNYVVGFDDGEATQKAYLEAFKKDGIPQTFVIDKKGNIVIILGGYPTPGLEEVIETILADKYDVKSLAKISEKAQEELAKQEKAKGELLRQYFKLVTSSKDAKDADKLGEQILKACAGNAGDLNEFAWTILTEESIQARDLGLALRAAKAALDACEGQDAGVLNTYARAWWDNGKKDEAIKYQKQAVEVALTDRDKAELEKTLKDYEAKLGEKK